VSVQGRYGGGAAFVVRLNRASAPDGVPHRPAHQPHVAETEDV
jgi:hypothetical protein